MFKFFIETSNFLLFVKRPWGCYCSFERWLDGVYKNSRICIIVKKFWATIQIYGRYSFLEKITESKEEGDFAILKNSAVVQRLINSYRKWTYKLSSYFQGSKTDNLIRQLRKDFYFLPIKTISIIIIIAIITNIIFSILLQEEIGLLGWILRYVLLFMGIGGLFCNADWENIKRTSFILGKD